MKNFNWNEFKKGKIVVYCNTKEKAINFISKCNSYNMKWSDGGEIELTECYFEECENGICYRFQNESYDTGLVFEELSYYNDFYSIIEWRIEKREDNMENKIDYDREYNILEFMEFEKGTEFTLDDRYICKVEDGYLKIKDGTGSWIIEHLAKEIIKAKFKLVKKDKKVSFKEAIQAYGKDIYCIYHDGEEETEVYYKVAHKYTQLEGNVQYSICPEQILNGEWYIKEN
ncbi:TPA: hypothetical protein ACXDAZ_002538 [Clostridium botulinum]